jgi:uncharacterized protein
MMLNRADECRQRADECRHNAAQVADDVLRGTYLDLARRWRMMAHQAGSLEQKEGTKKTRGFRIRLLAIALAVIAGSTAICGHASAQVYWGDRSSGGWGDRRSGGWGWDDWGDRRRRQTPSDFFSPFFGDRYNRPAPAVDSSKAPPPRKLETPPTSTVMVIGDSLADWLAYGLDEFYTDHPEIGFERKISATSGLIRYDAKNDRLDWSQITKDALAAEKPNAIIVMLGLNDRLPIREKALSSPEPQRKGEQRAQAAQAPQNSAQGEAATSADSEAAPTAENKAQHPAPGGSYDFQTDQWAALYAKRIDAMIATLKSNGVPIIWVGLPAMRGTKLTRDISYLDELYRERAEKAGIVYVDVWDGFVDDQGRYAIQGPDFEGQTRRLRATDGVHFTKAGAVKLASYVDRDLRRAISSTIVPVALPGPETTPKSGSAGARPDVGPVLPLTASGGERGDLLGAEGRPTQMTPDPIAAKVLSRGNALLAPAGRADDFSWPRPGSDALAAPELSPQPVALKPGAPTKNGVAVKDDGKKLADAKKDAKEKPAIELRASKPRHAPNPDLDGAPIPPAPVGSR